MTMAFSWRGCSLPTTPPPGGRRSSVEDPGILRGDRGGSVGSAFDFGPMCCRFESYPCTELNISAPPPVLRNWVIKGICMSSLVYATGHIKDPVPLIEKRRGLSPGGRFPPSFIHQVIIITRLNKLYNCMFSP